MLHFLRTALVASSLGLVTAHAQLIHHGPWVGAMTPETADVHMVLNEPRLTTLEVSTYKDFSWPAPTPQSARQPQHPPALAHFLNPSTTYYYRVKVGRKIEYQTIGTFRTFPLAHRPASFRFAFSSGVQTASEAGAFSEIRYQKPLFFLHLDNAHNTPDVPNKVSSWNLLQNQIFESFTQTELYQHVPIVQTWHNYDSGGSAAHTAYRSFIPHYPLPADAPGATIEEEAVLKPISQSFTVGRVKFIVLDTSTARTAFDSENPTLLGNWQLNWMKAELKAAALVHPLIFIVSAVPWHADQAVSGTDDHWGYYPAERDHLTEWLKTEKISGVNIISGNGGVLAAAIAADELGELSELQSGIIDLRREPAIGRWTDGPLLPDSTEEFFGIVDIDDQHSHLDVTFRGMNQHGHERFKSSFRVAVIKK